MSSSDKPKPFGILPMMLILFATLLVMTVGLNILGHKGSDLIDQVPARAANTLRSLAQKAHAAGLGCRPDDATPPASGTATRQVLLLTGETGVKLGEAASLARTVSVRCDTTPG